MTRAVVAGAILLTAVPAAAQRLPDTVVLVHYSLWFAPDLEKDTILGRQTVQAVVTQRTSSITIHAAELEFGEVSVPSVGCTPTACLALDPTSETATPSVP